MGEPHDRHDVKNLLKNGLAGLIKGDVQPFLDMFAEDGFMEFPFAPPGYPPRVGPKSALVEYFASFGENLEIHSVSEIDFHFTQDPDVVIAEFNCSGKAVHTGLPYDQRYISVITLRDGRIVLYRDYWNPVVGIVAMGGMDALQTLGTEVQSS